jgi:hypothetical protein
MTSVVMAAPIKHCGSTLIIWSAPTSSLSWPSPADAPRTTLLRTISLAAPVRN